MKYSIRVNEVKNKEGSLRGFATVVFGDSLKITNIAILENAEKHQLFVSMPRYRTSEKDEGGSVVYKDICNPITKVFREELYGNILETFECARTQGNGQGELEATEQGMPEFSISVVPFEKEDSNIKGLARIFLEDSFIINNVIILQGKETLFVAIPSY